MPARNRKTSSANRTLGLQESIRICDIVGLHPALVTAYGSLSIAPLRQVPERLLNKEDVMELAQIYPLRVCQINQQLLCSGNIRLFQFALRYLKPFDTIACIEETPPNEDMIIKRWLKEQLLGPVCLGAHFSDVNVLAELARKAAIANQLPDAWRDVDKFFSQLYGVDKRKLTHNSKKDQPTTQAKQIEQESTQNPPFPKPTLTTENVISQLPTVT